MRLITAEEARALREAATPDPWYVSVPDSRVPIVSGPGWPVACILGEDDDRPRLDGEPSTPLPLSDAALIAAAPDLAWSVEQLDAVRRAALQVGEEAHAALERVTAERDAARAEATRLAARLAEVAATPSADAGTLRAERDRLRYQLDRAHRRDGQWIAEVSSAQAEATRLARILAVERGDASQAPEGWVSAGADMWVRGRVIVQRYHRDGAPTTWTRRGEIDGPHWDTALAAMEAIGAEVSRG